MWNQRYVPCTYILFWLVLSQQEMRRNKLYLICFRLLLLFFYRNRNDINTGVMYCMVGLFMLHTLLKNYAESDVNGVAEIFYVRFFVWSRFWRNWSLFDVCFGKQDVSFCSRNEINFLEYVFRNGNLRKMSDFVKNSTMLIFESLN